MTGPEHYREAERLATPQPAGEFKDFEGRTLVRTTMPTADMIAAAQVHATLALTAATVEATIYGSQMDALDEWREVLA